MKIRIILNGMIVFFVFTVQVSFAQSLSDINKKAFDKFSAGEPRSAPTSPFIADSGTAEDLTIEDLVLTGVARSQMRSFALISGYLVQLGDHIAGFKVDSIEKDRVLLRRLDETYVLTMGGL